MSYLGNLAKAAYQAVKAINDYKGSKLVTLSTGEVAIDNDDAWIVVNVRNGFGEPFIRDKRAQRMLDKGEVSDMYDDVLLFDTWGYEEICEFADSLAQ